MGTIDSGEILNQLDGDLLDHLPVMVLVTAREKSPETGGEPIVEDCNDRFLERTKYRRGEVAGRPVADFYAPRSIAQMREGGYERSRGEGLDRVDRRLVAADGSAIDTVLSAVPRSEGERVLGAVCTST